MFSVDTNLRKKQEICLEIMQIFNQLCFDNDINYFLGYGSLLGAVRNKGFISWDDDIDVWMKRDDYEKLIKIANDKLPKNIRLEHYSLCETKDDVKTHHIQVVNTDYILRKEWAIKKTYIHPWIDVFPIDGLPDNRIKMYVHYFRFMFWWFLMQLSLFEKNTNVIRKRGILERIVIFIIEKTKVGARLNTLRIISNMENVSRKYKFGNTKKVSSFYGIYKRKEILNTECFKNNKEIEFENIVLRIPVKYDEVLKNYYGENYMKPVEKKSCHLTTFVCC